MIILAGKMTIMTLVVVIVVGMCIITVSAASMVRGPRTSERYYHPERSERKEEKDRG